ncbi:hypothetical protein COBT_003289 [Conglomerata obtusa]
MKVLNTDYEKNLPKVLLDKYAYFKNIIETKKELLPENTIFKHDNIELTTESKTINEGRIRDILLKG